MRTYLSKIYNNVNYRKKRIFADVRSSYKQIRPSGMNHMNLTDVLRIADEHFGVKYND